MMGSAGAAWRTSPLPDDFPVAELVISVLAHTLADGDQACNGMASFVPVSAFMLARATHAHGMRAREFRT